MADPHTRQAYNEYLPGLEVVPHQDNEDRTSKDDELHEDSHKEVASGSDIKVGIEDGLEVGIEAGIEVVRSDSQKEVVPVSKVETGIEVARHDSQKEVSSEVAKRGGLPNFKERKKLWICIIVSASVVVALLIGLLVRFLPERNQKPSPTSVVPATPTATSTGTSGNMTGTSLATTRYLYPTAVSWGYPHLEVLALSTNSTASIYRKFRDSNATSDSDWNPKGSSLAVVGGDINVGSSVAVLEEPNFTNVFITSQDSKLYHKYHRADENWVPSDNWYLLESTGSVSMPVVTHGATTEDVFVLAKGTNTTTIHHISYTVASNKWGRFDDLGGRAMQFTPAAVTWDGIRIDVFGVSLADNHLLHTWWDGKSWQKFNGSSLFEDLGGFCASSPVVITRTNGTLDVFARGGDGGLWYLQYNGKWADWTRISGRATIQAQPDVLSWDPDRIDVFAWGSDNSLLTKTLSVPTGQWTPSDGFDVIGTGLAGPPTSVSDADGSIHVFVYGLNNTLMWKHWNVSMGDKWPSSDFVKLGTLPS